MARKIKLSSPEDLRELIRGWIQEVTNDGKLPFESGGVIVQMLQVWLRSYELQNWKDLQDRVAALERSRHVITEDNNDPESKHD